MKKTQPKPETPPAAAPDIELESSEALARRLRNGRPAPKDICAMMHRNLDEVLVSGKRKYTTTALYNLHAWRNIISHEV